MKELYKNTWTYEDEMVRIFLIAGSKRALIVDTGFSGLDVDALTAAHTDLPRSLLFTHADGDHIFGKHHFKEVMMHPSEACLYRMHQKETEEPERIVPVYEGDVIDLGDRELEVIHLPGHTPGSITLLDRDERCLIGGDPILEDGEIYMFGPHRNLEMYIASLERLAERTDFDAVYPSHANEKVGREVIPELIRGAKAVMAGEIGGEEVMMHGQKARCCDIGPSRLLIDP